MLRINFISPLIALDPVQKVTLASSNKDLSLKYWSGLLGLKLFADENSQLLLGYSENQAKLELKVIGEC